MTQKRRRKIYFSNGIDQNIYNRSDRFMMHKSRIFKVEN